MNFQLNSPYEPTGDQPGAIQKLVEKIRKGQRTKQTLLGVTGSGKTFTIANVIQKINKPTLVISHNKTLAAQLYGEFKQFFPHNAVEYFISYYDYYQPEAYLPTTDLYIEKDLAINSEIEKLRLSATASLLSGRKDVIIVASVSCIYGMCNPKELQGNILQMKVGDKIARTELLYKLVDMLYSRDDENFQRGTFRVRGETIDVFLAYADYAYRFLFFNDEIEAIYLINPQTGRSIQQEKAVSIFPANLFIITGDTLKQTIAAIETDLEKQVKFFEAKGQKEEAIRIQKRTQLDIEMLEEIKYCPGIENYSRYFDKRAPGERPFCLLDYFPKDYLMVIDESHVTIPQIKAMYGGDRMRKTNLVDYGFRIPSALDNRPLNFEEFESLMPSVIFVSATPTEYEITQSKQEVVEQIIRPTGLLDPEIIVKPSQHQIDDLIDSIQERIGQNERVIITTLTKRMAEELTKYLKKIKIKAEYLHSDIKTLERVRILRNLRLGDFDVLIGVNLLREGLDLPEVSLIAILDADKEGFLRNTKALIQTIGRAARNQNGYVIMYADKITDSMRAAIEETQRRRKLQMAYNVKYKIIPKTIQSSTETILGQTKVADKESMKQMVPKQKAQKLVAEIKAKYKSTEQLEKVIEETETNMKEMARQLEFSMAANLRDQLHEFKKALQEIQNDSK